MTNTYVVYENCSEFGLRRQTFHTYKKAGQYANYLVECGLCDRVTIDILLHNPATNTVTVLQSIPVLRPS